MTYTFATTAQPLTHTVQVKLVIDCGALTGCELDFPVAYKIGHRQDTFFNGHFDFDGGLTGSFAPAFLEWMEFSIQGLWLFDDDLFYFELMDDAVLFRLMFA